LIRRLLHLLVVLTAYVLGAGTFVLLSGIGGARVTTARDYEPEPVTLRIRTHEDAARTRETLYRFLFGSTPPSSTMQHGFVSTPTVHAPQHPTGDLVIYHTGHAGETPDDSAAIGRFVDAGYTVAVFDMPLMGRNPAVWVDLPDLGRTRLSTHDHMAFLGPVTDGHPVRLFVEPVLALLDEMGDAYGRILMTGVSGGGWTTTLAAALDLRIDASYPVAGSLPLAIRFARPDAWGDWEQHVPELYAIADYADLYALGAQGRRQVQVLNYHDPCCFAGDHRALYEAQTAAAAQRLGGTFSVYLDVHNPDHSLSAEAQAWIITSDQFR
jgi:dienelactone hydrolase